MYFSVASLQEITSFSLTSSTSVNSAIATYTFLVTFPIPLVDGDKLYILAPSEITNPTSSSPTCQGASSNIENNLSCQSSSIVLRITLDFPDSQGNQLASGTSFSFNVSGYQNPSSTDASSNFRVYAIDSNN